MLTSKKTVRAEREEGKEESTSDQLAQTPTAYTGFCSIKQTGAFLLLPARDATPSQGYPQC